MKQRTFAEWNWGRTGPGMLFDGKNGRLQVNNLIDEPYTKDTREQWAQLLAQWQAGTADGGKRDSVRSFQKK